jgi:hypothetical protein
MSGKPRLIVNQIDLQDAAGEVIGRLQVASFLSKHRNDGIPRGAWDDAVIEELIDQSVKVLRTALEGGR